MNKFQNVSLFLALILGLAFASHIDDSNGELSKFTYDKVIFRSPKDCSLDKYPEVRKFMEDDSQRYPDLDVFVDDGAPRFDLLREKKVVDSIRVHRFDLQAFRKLLKELGVERDENSTWEKKAAKIKMERAFKQTSTGASQAQQSNSSNTEQKEVKSEL